jgi:hypothetical protein
MGSHHGWCSYTKLNTPRVGAASSRDHGDDVAPRMVLLLGAMKKLIPFAVIFFVFVGNLFGLSKKMADTGVEIKVEKEWKGNHCGYTEPDKLVIKTEDRWREVWEKMHRLQLPGPKPPAIDFKKNMVIAVFMGERKTGGYEIEITRIEERKKEIVVEVEEKEPPPESMRTMTLTQPYHIVVIKRSPFPVKFRHPQK